MLSVVIVLLNYHELVQDNELVFHYPEDNENMQPESNSNTNGNKIDKQVNAVAVKKCYYCGGKIHQ